MPKYRVPISQRAHACHHIFRFHPINYPDSSAPGNAPTMIDVRIDEDFAADPRLIPGAARRAHPEVQEWASQLTGQSVVVVCQKGQKLSEGTAAWLRHTSVAAEVLEGGHVGWRQSRSADGPGRQDTGTGRARPHGLGNAITAQDRPHRVPVADPPLHRSQRGIPVRRGSRSPSRGRAVQRNAFRHGERVLEPSRRTVHVRRDGRGVRARDRRRLQRLATMVRAADTGRLDLSPEAPGLLAASLGLSRMYDDDLEQLSAGMLLYDAFFRWCRDATKETHNWPTNKAKP